MRIALNLLYLLPGEVGGTQTYATELMRALDQFTQNDEYLVFVNAESNDFAIPASPRFKKIVCRVHATNRAKRYLFEQLVLPFLAIWHGADVLHSLGYVGPVVAFQKHIITIHDANFVRLSPLMSPVKRWVYGVVARLSARSCNHILTISSFAKAELVECLGVVADKITVVHHGAPIPDESALGKDRADRLAPPKPYILVLGGGSRHKNIRSFVEAFAKVQDRFPHDLVIAGHVKDSLDDLPEILSLIKSNRIRITGYLSDADLDAAFRGAALFVFPTLYEGFGFPILEAQIRKTPVLCSRIASLPEIGEDSVAYFDPSSIQDMATKLANLLQEPETLKDLVERGLKNTQRFTWEQAAVQTHALYCHTLL